MPQRATPQLFRRHGLILTAVTGAVITLAACGGGGGGSTPSSSTKTAVTYSGTVTGLGSIVVNGVRFSTIGANTTDPDDPTQSYSDAFALGSSVTVTGTIDPNTGTVGQATAIVVHGGVRGVVSGISGNTFMVAGQTVQVDANTLYADGASLAALSGKPVEVHGTLGTANVLLASRVELESIDDKPMYPYAVIGRVSDVTASTFSLALSPTATMTLPIPTGVTMSNGMTVRVLSKSVLQPSTYAASELTNGNIKIIVKGERSLSGETKVRGSITSPYPSLAINGIPIDTTQNPKLDDIQSLSDLTTVGQIIKVEGRMSNGTLIAREIEADEYEHKSGTGKYEDRVKLYGVVTANDDTDDTFVVQGVTVTDPDGTPPSVGSYVEVKAYLNNGVLTAREVSDKTSTSGSRFETYGTASCDKPDLSGLGKEFTLTTAGGTTLTVNGSAAREVKYDDDALNKTGMGSYRCFLEVEGSVSNGVIMATEIEVKQRTEVTPSR